MDYKEIQDLIKLVKKNQISELEIEKDDFKIFIRSEGEEKVVVQAAPQQPIMPAATQQVQQPAQQAPQSQPQQSQSDQKDAQDSNLVEITYENKHLFQTVKQTLVHTHKQDPNHIKHHMIRNQHNYV